MGCMKSALTARTFECPRSFRRDKDIANMSSLTKKRLSTAISQFSADVRTASQRWDEGVASLKRAIDNGVTAGPHEFKEQLNDLEEDVASITVQLEQLEQHTTQAISFEELIGHCTGLYHSNRQGVLQLEAHLKQYGYQAPGPLQQPEDPLAAAHSRMAQDAGEESDQCEDDVRGARPDTVGATAPRVTMIGSRAAPNTPHYVMSQEAKAKLRGRVKTPGISLAQLRMMDSSDDEEDEYDDEIEGRGRGRGSEDDVMPWRHQQQQQQQQAAGAVGAAAAVGHQLRGQTPPRPSAQASWGDDDEEDEEEEQVAAGRLGTQGAAGTATGGRAGVKATLTTPAAGKAAPAAWAQPVTTRAGVAGAGAASAAQARAPVTPDTSDSMTPEGMFMSPSFAALQARYGGGGAAQEAATEAQEGGGAGAQEAPAAGRDNGGVELGGGAPSLAGLTLAGHDDSDEDEHDDWGTVGSSLGQPAFNGGWTALPPASSSGHQLAALPTTSHRHGSTNFPPPAEEDTCSLYAQLIRSRDVPTSLATASGRSSTAMLSRSMSALVPPRVTGAAASGAQHPGAARGEAQGLSGLQGAVAAGRGGGGMQAGAGGADGVPAVSPRSKSAPRSPLARAQGAQATKALEDQLSTLQQQWEVSGQAALTPRRAAAASSVSLHAQQPTPSLSLFADLPAAPAASTRPTFDPAAATSCQGFEFPRVLGTSQGATSGAGVGLAGQAAPAWLQQGAHLAAAPQPAAQAASGGATPALSGAHRSLSPGTASLLSRVYGGSTGARGAEGASTGALQTAATATAQPRPTSFTAQPTPSITAKATAAPPLGAAPAATAIPTGNQAGGAVRGTGPGTGGSASATPTPVSEAEFAVLPLFLRNQVPRQQLNAALAAMPGLAAGDGGSVAEGGTALSLSFDTVQEGLGYSQTQARALVNCLVKLSRATMQTGARFSVRM